MMVRWISTEMVVVETTSKNPSYRYAEGGIFSFTMNETTDNIGYIFYQTFVRKLIFILFFSSEYLTRLSHMI